MKYNIKLVLCHLKVVETRYFDWPWKIILGLENYKANMLHTRKTQKKSFSWIYNKNTKFIKILNC